MDDYQFRNEDTICSNSLEQNKEPADPLSRYFPIYNSSPHNDLCNFKNNPNSKETRTEHVQLNQNISSNFRQSSDLLIYNSNMKVREICPVKNSAAPNNKTFLQTQVRSKHKVLAKRRTRCRLKAEACAHKRYPKQNIVKENGIGHSSLRENPEHLSINRSSPPLTLPSSPGTTIKTPRVFGSNSASAVLEKSATGTVPEHTIRCLNTSGKVLMSTKFNRVELAPTWKGLYIINKMYQKI